MSIGTLYLLPVPLGPIAPDHCLPTTNLEVIRKLRHFVVENAKSARSFLKTTGIDVPIQSLALTELNEHTPASGLSELLAPLEAGHDLGLLSEAGCPAIADPGANLVALAQNRGITVRPLVGPSSILLSLMASGLNGQQFAFHGYLPAKELERQQTLRNLEADSRKNQRTQIFIETPYRNTALFNGLIQHLHPATRLCVAVDLTLPQEIIHTRTIAQWRTAPPPSIERRPTIFLLLASSVKASR